jgi:hypothetical protein
VAGADDAAVTSPQHCDFSSAGQHVVSIVESQQADACLMASIDAEAT